MKNYIVKVQDPTNGNKETDCPIQEENMQRAQMRASLFFGSANVLDVIELEEEIEETRSRDIYYAITIVEIESNTVSVHSPKEGDLDKCVTAHLGGWMNLNIASTSSSKLEKGNYQQAGSTKDGKKLFSILCY